jgi:hypothetical protein
MEEGTAIAAMLADQVCRVNVSLFKAESRSRPILGWW